MPRSKVPKDTSEKWGNAFLRKVPPGIERWPDRAPVLVMRPSDPSVRLMLAKIALDHQNPDALKEAASGPGMFVGFLKRLRDGRYVTVDEDGKNPAPLEKGDIFITPEAVAADADTEN